MLFEKKFKIIEIRVESGVVIAHYLRGKRKEIEKDIETCKNNAKRYEMIGKAGMVVWV